MAETRTVHRLRSGPAFWICIGVGTLLLVYLLAFGPVCFLAKQLSVSRDSASGRALITVFYPHFALASRLEWYFRYVSWCTGREATHDTFRRFQQDFRSGAY